MHLKWLHNIKNSAKPRYYTEQCIMFMQTVAM